MRAPAAGRLERLGRENPEWRPWVGTLSLALREAAGHAWESSVPAVPSQTGVAPLLAGAVLHVRRAVAQRWIDALLGTAIAGGGRAGEALAPARGARLDVLAFLEAAVCQDQARLDEQAEAVGAGRAAWRAVADLAVLPLLQACRRLWARASETWREGYCPVCGAWPALAESRGVERSRRFRCARCGSDWKSEWLRCPFCDTRDHTLLGALAAEGSAERRKIETCSACHGYLKLLTTLEGGPGVEVIVDDLASVDLDVIAMAEGYARPAGLGHPLVVRVEAKPGFAILGRR